MAGDVVEVVSTPEHGVTVRQLFTRTDPSALARLLELGQDLPPKAVAAAEQVLARGGHRTPPDPHPARPARSRCLIATRPAG